MLHIYRISGVQDIKHAPELARITPYTLNPTIKIGRPVVAEGRLKNTYEGSDKKRTINAAKIIVS